MNAGTASAAPAISVIMPAFNCAAYIAEAIGSICTQTFGDLELIVVDDGSTDGTLEIIEWMAAEDGRIRPVRGPRSGRPSAARNRGLQHARADLIAFQDGDDVAHPDRLRREHLVFQRYPQVDLVFADLRKFSGPLDRCEGAGWLAQDRFLERAAQYLLRESDDVYLCVRHFYRFMSTELTAVNMQTAMLRRSALAGEPYCFNEELLVGEDADLFFRLARRCQLAFIATVLGYYRQRPDSLTHQPEARLESEIRVYADNLAHARREFTPQEVARCRHRLALRYWDLGYLRYAEGDMQAARRAYATALRLDPQLGTVSALVKTWAPTSVIRWARARNARKTGATAGDANGNQRRTVGQQGRSA